MALFFKNIFFIFVFLIGSISMYGSEPGETTLPNGQKVRATNVFYYPNSNSLYFVACVYGYAANITLPDGQQVKAKYITFYEDGSILSFTLIDGDVIDIKLPNGDTVKTYEVRYTKDKVPHIVKEDDNLYHITLPDAKDIKAQSVFYDNNGILNAITLADEESIILKIKGKTIKARQRIEFNNNGSIKSAK